MLKNKKKTFLVGVTLVLLLIAGFIFWLYFGKINSVKAIVFKAIPFPAVLVDGNFVSMDTLVKRYEMLKSIENSAVIMQREEIEAEVFDKLTEDGVLEALAAERGIKPTKDNLDSLYKQLAGQLAGGDESKLETVLDGYSNLSKEDFKNTILKIYFLTTELKTWYNSQNDFNKAVFAKAEKIKSLAATGEDFSALTKQYSDDGSAAVFSGDSGFFDPEQLSSGLQKGLQSLKAGEITILPSSEGLHVIKLLERTPVDAEGEKIRVQQIFLQETGYEKWFSEQVKKAKVIKFTKYISF